MAALADQAVRQPQTPAHCLAQLVHLEVTACRERRIQDARFPMLKTPDAFSFEVQPALDRDAPLQVFDCRFVAEATTVVFCRRGQHGQDAFCPSPWGWPVASTTTGCGS
ncbi:MAG: hypothetical protein OXP08_02880 [bacterium]|nr:hypothetical protein [bacterium]